MRPTESKTLREFGDAHARIPEDQTFMAYWGEMRDDSEVELKGDPCVLCGLPCDLRLTPILSWRHGLRGFGDVHMFCDRVLASVQRDHYKAALEEIANDAPDYPGRVARAALAETWGKDGLS